MGDSAFAKKEADLRSSFSRRERELQDAFDELYERNQVRHIIPCISPATNLMLASVIASAAAGAQREK